MSTRRLGDSGLTEAVTRAQGRVQHGYWLSPCSCASSLPQASILSSAASPVAATILLEFTYTSVSVVAGFCLLNFVWMCPWADQLCSHGGRRNNLREDKHYHHCRLWVPGLPIHCDISHHASNSIFSVGRHSDCSLAKNLSLCLIGTAPI